VSRFKEDSYLSSPHINQLIPTPVYHFTRRKAKGKLVQDETHESILGREKKNPLQSFEHKKIQTVPSKDKLHTNPLEYQVHYKGKVDLDANGMGRKLSRMLRNESKHGTTPK